MRSEEFDTMTEALQDELPANHTTNQTGCPRKKGSNPLAWLVHRIGNDPDLSIQLIIILLTLAADNLRMDRRIDTMSAKIDAVRNISEVLTNAMRSLKTAAQAPAQIRRLLE